MSSATNDTEQDNQPTVSEIFNDIWKIWEYLESCDVPTNSEEVQGKVKKACELSEKAIQMVNQLRLFSNNEDLEEVATNEIKYMLLPALLGYFKLKVTSGDRMAVIKRAQGFYTDFLQMCSNYSVMDIVLPEVENSDDEETDKPAKPQPNTRPGPPDLSKLQAQRNQRIERFKQQKQFEKEILELKSAVEKEHVDDEVKRIYYTTLLKKWVGTSQDDVQSVKEELPILRHMNEMKMSGSQSNGSAQSGRPKADSKSSFRPFILTKDSVQKAVYGAGYPSLPTYSLDDFYDRQVELGNLPPPGTVPGMPGPSEAEEKEKEEVEKEMKVEDDDPETLQKARNWEEWTDDHRRGWGNTHNKG